jgi:hypothetical protein
MASKGPKVSKQGTAGKRKCVTLISQKLEIISRLEVANARCVDASTNIGLSTVYGIKKRKD